MIGWLVCRRGKALPWVWVNSCGTTLNAAPPRSIRSVRPPSPGGPGEAVFAPAHSEVGELSGWYLPYVYDPAW
jgi:hypothetical protein